MGPPALIVAGGQTGVDRAALDVAVAAEIDYGGWCPRGGWAEDLTEPPGVRALYPGLAETPSSDPEQRTRWNVRDSDATLIVLPSRAAVSAGTALALSAALDLDRELAVVHLDDSGSALAAACALLRSIPDGSSLNVAGPRESEAPGIYRAALALLSSLLAPPG